MLGCTSDIFYATGLCSEYDKQCKAHCHFDVSVHIISASADVGVAKFWRHHGFLETEAMEDDCAI